MSIGAGGLFDHWAGDPGRAPRWIRRLGAEWGHKWRRYVLGNPRFVVQVLRDSGRVPIVGRRAHG